MSLRGKLQAYGLSFYDGKAEFSVPVIAQGGVSGPVGQGDIYYVDPVDGATGNSGKTPGTAVKTLAAAYAKMSADQNDELRYLANTSGITLTANFEWALNYTHFRGICPPTPVAQRARIFGSDTAGTLTKLFKVSASNCMFSNLYLFQGGTHASDIGCFEVTGTRNYFWNIHFAGMGHATPAAQTGSYSLLLTGAAECLFEECTIGLDTITRGAANAEIQIASDCKRLKFSRCMIQSQSDTAGHVAINIAAGGLDRWLWLDNCLVYNFSVNHATTLTCAITDSATATHDILLTGQNTGLKGYGYWAGAGVPIYTNIAAPNNAGGEMIATATS
jgi:hypothetical protein